MAKMRAAQITDPNGPVELSSAKYPNREISRVATIVGEKFSGAKAMRLGFKDF